MARQPVDPAVAPPPRQSPVLIAMADFFLRILFMLGAVLAGILSLAGVAVVATVCYAFLLPASYLRSMMLTLRSAPQGPGLPAGGSAAEEGAPPDTDRPAAEPLPHAGARDSAWLGPHRDQHIAMPSYFFGPATDDLGHVVATCARDCRARLADGWGRASDVLNREMKLPAIIGWAGITIGIVAGGLIGLATAAVIGLVNLLVTALTVLAALCAWQLIRAADWSRRKVASIRMTCPMCGMKVKPYPTYRCPGCAQRHRDIRPGPYGIVCRLCRCEARLPTSLLFGAGRLAAVCPNCGAGLPRKFGTVPDITIPLFGAVNVGKTQLMYRLTQALYELVTTSGGKVTFEGDTKERLNRIGDHLTVTGQPAKTRAGQPEGYTLRFTLGMEQRLVYLFDAAGELHYNRDGLARLDYLGQARVLIFVADPLAAECLWQQIPAERQEELEKIRSRQYEVQLAYQNTREQMREMGIKTGLTKLAFVVSKADLLAEAGPEIQPGTSRQDLRTWAMDPEGLDMGNEVREAEQGFAEVQFFRTAAVLGSDGFPDSSVEVLAQWLMRSEGIIVGGWGSDGP